MRFPVAALILALAAACSPSEQKAAEQPKTETPASAEQPPVDPAAIQALETMGAYLRTLQSFEVRAETTRDFVLEDTEQKVQFAGDGVYRIRRPNAFYLEANTDRRHQQYYYDGTTFTVFSPRMHAYAQRPAPATIREMVDEMRDRYGMEVPLADLFYWGTESVEDVQLASVIGFARINDQPAGHYAFRQGDVDWQIWIADGDRPLPLKVVVTTRDDPAQPQFTSVLTWNLSPRFSDATFAFRAPNDAHQIRIAEQDYAEAN